MVCGTTTYGTTLAIILVPALVVPFVLANIIGWTAFGIHKHRKNKRQREHGQGGGYGSAAGAGNTFVTSTGPGGETVVSVVPAGGAAGTAGTAGAAGSGGGAYVAGGPGSAGGAGGSGTAYTTGGGPVQRQVVQIAGGPRVEETMVVA
ncbi:unnamed protein product [Aureobasidium vineae]|uniref:Uncharacterized protein n=1 Tax=Aureobasidium vineae TaxID=2773715 RepID=A0A9N8K283_9PEZI|nr:unnamed protein product [Aureobasidium vineae]